MTQLTIRDVPENVARALRAEAKESGQSLNTVARAALREHVEQRGLVHRISAMRELRDDIRRSVGDELSESVHLIAEDRHR